MKKLEQGYAGVLALVYVAILLVAGGGWVANIVKLVGMDMGSLSGMVIVRVAGIFVPPLGAVMGYL